MKVKNLYRVPFSGGYIRCNFLFIKGKGTGNLVKMSGIAFVSKSANEKEKQRKREARLAVLEQVRVSLFSICNRIFHV